MKRFFAWASLLLLVSWRSTGQPTPSPTPSPTYVVTCDGTATMIQQGLYGIADAALQSMVPIASNGPNLILNGDFSYDSAGDDQNAPGTRWSLIQSSFTNPSPARLIQSWVAYGGGSNTYAGMLEAPPYEFDSRPSQLVEKIYLYLNLHLRRLGCDVF